MNSISVVINTLNEEKNLPKALSSVKKLADEIVIVDMESSDNTAKIAKEAGAKVFSHKRTGYVEPARNYAISKAKGEWILILDADEEIPSSLAEKLSQIAKNDSSVNFYKLPRKNIVFDKWLEHSRWWPDYNIRFFKAGKVKWDDAIHSVPETSGESAELPATEDNAIIHYHYTSISQFVERLNHYTDIQSMTLEKKGYQFFWQDLIRKPLGEFLSRFFAGEGYKDGVHGLALGLLQGFSELVLYLKMWEKGKFTQKQLSQQEIKEEIEHIEYEAGHWLEASKVKKRNIVSKLLTKLHAKASTYNRFARTPHY